MSTVPLPECPDLGQLRTRARELQRAVRAGDLAACAEATEHLPDVAAGPAFALSGAQAVLARHYRFASWARLVWHVQIINARTFVLPDAARDEPPTDQFLRLGCLNYAEDAPSRWAAAERLREAHPHLSERSVAVASACGAADTVARLLRAGASATAPAAPFGWTPLMYQAYARVEVGRDDTLATTSALLGAGADPNDGRFFLGLPTPFTVLTGVFGGGEGAQPAHPHAVPLARLLLDAGADPNDGQTLYNRMFARGDDFLELLLEFGLGHGDGGPWRRLLGEQVESPQTMVRALLEWAITHDQTARIELLAHHGVDVISPLHNPRLATRRPRVPLELAMLSGNAEVADLLRRHGAVEPPLRPAAAVIAAALAGDTAAVTATAPDALAAARRARPGLIVWATSRHLPDAVRLLVDAGWDVNAYARADVPREQQWQTALHTAAGDGDLDLVRLLLERGADPALRDRRFDGTARDWAEHFGHAEVAALL